MELIMREETKGIGSISPPVLGKNKSYILEDASASLCITE